MRKHIIFLLLACFCLFHGIDGMASDSQNGIECSTPSDTTNHSDKTVPLYRFKDDVTGRFLARFCDSLGYDGPYKVDKPTTAYVSVDYNCMRIDEVEHLGFTRKNNYNDYIYVTSDFIDSALISITEAVIETQTQKLILLQSRNDSLLDMLHVRRDGSYTLHELQNALRMLCPDPSSAVLHIMSDGKVDPVHVYDNREKSFDERFGWIYKFYKDNSFSTTAGCDFLPSIYIPIAFMFNSIPKKITTGYDASGNMINIVEINLSDIIKPKHINKNFSYKLKFPYCSKEEMSEYFESIKEFYRDCEKHSNRLWFQ